VAATLRDQIRANLSRRKTWEIREAEGFVTSKLAHQLKVEPASLAVALRRMEADGEIQRDVQGKRTYAIRLLDLGVEGTPPAASNGHRPASERQSIIDTVVSVLDEHTALVEENADLHKELGKAEEKIEAQSLQIAALTRQVEAAKGTSKKLEEIQEMLRKIG
jgi:DNA-binding MarR family transcriptional regulator